MKLQVGRLILGCMLAVLVLADEPVVEMVTEKLAVVPEVVVSNSTTVAPEVPKLSIKGKIFAKPTVSDSHKVPHHEIIVIPDHGHRPNHGHHDHDNDHDHDDHHHNHGNDNHHHHHDNDNNHHHHHDNDNHHHHHDNDHDNHHHHHHEDDHHHNHHTSPHRPPIHPLPPSQQHHHHMPPYHPYYPPYYPPPPPPYHYGHQMYAPVPQIPHPYPYYPPSYYSDPVKPITVIHSNDNNGHGNDNHGSGRPTDLLWNLIDHKNNELWNLFGGKHGENNKEDGGVHEIVVINAKPGSGHLGHTGTHGSNSGWGIKGKNFADNDCNEKH